MSREVTLSIVSHGHGELLARLLGQLNDAPALHGVRVVATLNLCGEPFDPCAWPNLDICTIRNSAPKGFGANHNAAFERCVTKYFAVLNPDLSFAGEEPFGRLMMRLRSDPHVGLVAPRVLSAQGSFEDSVRANLTPCSLLARHALGRRQTLDVSEPARRPGRFYWFAGMCLVIDARAYAAVSGFDERFFLYCEDYDLCARLYDAGWGLALEPEARIVHDARRDSRTRSRHLLWHVEGLLRVWTSRAFWRVTAGSRDLV